MPRARNPRTRQIIIGALILGGVALIIPLSYLGTALPGVLGEWMHMIFGFITTPFILEATFVIVGLMIVFALNHWRMKREGDEFVYLEENHDLSKDVPESERFAVYGEKPNHTGDPTLLNEAEGALAIGDYAAAGEAIAAMAEGELSKPEVLKVRIALAKATDHLDLAKSLEEKLKAAG